MKIKNTLAVLCSFALLTSIPLSTNAAETTKSNISIKEKIYCKATLNDDFSDKKFTIVSYDKDHQLEQELAQDPSVQSYEELMSADINDENFKRIVSVTLKNNTKSKANVLNKVKTLEKKDYIKLIEPDYNIKLSNDIYSKNLSDTSTLSTLNFEEQWSVNAISLNKAKVHASGSTSIKVGVIDTGIANHTELSGNLGTGYDFVNNNSVTTDDVVGHGTFIAGIIGAKQNKIVVKGVNQNVTIVPLQVYRYNASDSKACISSNAVVSAIAYAKNNNIPIINCSFSNNEAPGIIEDAIDLYPGLVVCSAGNDGEDNDLSVVMPANYVAENIISVANTNYSDELSKTSSYGATMVDLAAPGTNINSLSTDNDYISGSGTSFSAPYVAGAAALIKSLYPDFTTTQLKNALLNSVDKLSSLTGKVLTGGRLNVDKALDISTMLHSKKLLVGDFNGDGLDDTVNIAKTGTNKTEFYVKINTGEESLSDWSPWYSSSSMEYNNFADRIDAGDFNGDGKDDIALMYFYNDYSVKILVFLSTGTSFSCNTWTSWPVGAYNANNVTGRFTAGDFNGDGKDDISVMYMYGNDGPTKIFTYFSTGSRFTSSETISWPAGAYNANNVTGRFTSGDFNGDGKDDLAAMFQASGGETNIYVYISNGTSFSGSQSWRSWPAGSYTAANVNYRFTSADFTGDGLDDLCVMYYNGGDPHIYMHISNGNEFTGSKDWKHWPASAYSGNSVSRHFAAGKLNLDNYADIFVTYKYGNTTNFRSEFYGYTSNGTTLNYNNINL